MPPCCIVHGREFKTYISQGLRFLLRDSRNVASRGRNSPRILPMLRVQQSGGGRPPCPVQNPCSKGGNFPAYKGRKIPRVDQKLTKFHFRASPPKIKNPASLDLAEFFQIAEAGFEPTTFGL